MGVLFSSGAYRDIYSTHGVIATQKESFENIGIRSLKLFYLLLFIVGLSEKNVGELYKMFSNNRIDSSGAIRIRELVYHMHITGERFMTRVCQVFSRDKTHLDFLEFVYAVWNFCTLRNKQKSYDQFVFELYEDSCCGVLTVSQAQMAISDIYGDDLPRNIIAAKAHKALGRGEGRPMTFQDFQRFVDEHVGVLFQVRNYQHKLRTRVLGERQWETLSNVRVKINGGKQCVHIEQWHTVSNSVRCFSDCTDGTASSRRDSTGSIHRSTSTNR